MFRTCLYHRHILAGLAWRSLLGGRHGQSGGVFWAFAQPAISIAVYLTVFLTLFRSKVEIGGIVHNDYEVFVLSGMIPWLLISDVVSRAGSVLRDGGSLIRHGANIPPELIPVGTWLAQTLPFLLQLLLLVVWIWVAEGMRPLAWVMLAGALTITLAATAGLSMLLSAVGGLWRGLGEFTRIYVMIGIFLCPVFYTGEQMPAAMRLALDINPATWLVRIYRDALFLQQPSQPAAWALAVTLAVAVLIVGRLVFSRAAPLLGGRL